MFCRGEIGSVSIIKDCLISFPEMSGLTPNPDKSNIFMCGVDESVKCQLLASLGYKEGTLPVRYLGVPLISSRLKKVDCSILVDKIVGRVKSWTCKALSYAGRLQLVNSILFSIQVYWSSLFVLPMGVIKQVEEILRSFLWKGSELKSSGAKVAWDVICRPKKEGGLGLKRVDLWNRAAMLKHLWHICFDKDHSIWSNWVRVYLIKGRDFWALKLPGDCSWSWRKIWKLRPLAHGRIVKVAGNGNSPYTLVWKGSPSGSFSIKSAWDSLRPRAASVFWHKLVWHRKAIPRHAFILWLATLGRLPTKDVLSKHGMSVDLTCILCGQEEESLNHLFFSCSFSSSIWISLCGKCNIPSVAMNWEDTLRWMAQTFRGNSLSSLTARLMFAAVVYGIWRERNSRLFQGRALDVANVCYEILFWIRAKMNSLRGLHPTAENSWFFSSWGLSCTSYRS